MIHPVRLLLVCALAACAYAQKPTFVNPYCFSASGTAAVGTYKADISAITVCVDDSTEEIHATTTLTVMGVQASAETLVNWKTHEVVAKSTVMGHTTCNSTSVPEMIFIGFMDPLSPTQIATATQTGTGANGCTLWTETLSKGLFGYSLESTLQFCATQTAQISLWKESATIKTPKGTEQFSVTLNVSPAASGTGFQFGPAPTGSFPTPTCSRSSIQEVALSNPVPETVDFAASPLLHSLHRLVREAVVAASA